MVWFDFSWFKILIFFPLSFVAIPAQFNVFFFFSLTKFGYFTLFWWKSLFLHYPLVEYVFFLDFCRDSRFLPQSFDKICVSPRPFNRIRIFLLRHLLEIRVLFCRTMRKFAFIFAILFLNLLFLRFFDEILIFSQPFVEICVCCAAFGQNAHFFTSFDEIRVFMILWRNFFDWIFLWPNECSSRFLSKFTYFTAAFGQIFLFSAAF